MKKTILSLFTVTVLLLCTLLLSSCGNRLDTPENFREITDTVTLYWDRVPGARNYSVQISGEDRVRTTKTNYISLENLAPGLYTIQVKALGDGVETDDSQWASYPFERKAESGLKYKLINNGTEYQLIGGGTASGDVVMESEFRNKPVTSIAAKAFSGNTKITSLTVGEYVKTVGEKAFTKCSALKSIDFSKATSLTSIGEYAFQSCKNLETVAFPDSITEISPYTFSWCSALTSITVGSSLTRVGMYAFSNCEALTSMTLPDTLQVIEEYAFSDCKSLSTLVLGNAVEEIGTYAFYNCEKIAKVDFGKKLVSIGEAAFGNCKTLTAITIPDTCAVIENEAFRNCTALETITLGSGLTSLGAYAFRDTKAYENAEDIFCLGNWAVECKNLEIEELSLSQEIYGIADAAFAGCAKLERLNLPGIRYIGSSAFSYCAEIQTATFNDALLTIGDSAFSYCTYLRKIDIGNSVTRIGNYAFSHCSRLDGSADGISLPLTLVSMGTGAFYDTYGYNKVSVGLVYAGDWAVDLKLPGGYGLTDIVFADGTRGIADYCCNEAPVLFTITIADSVEYIGKGAFYNCSMVQAIGLPKSLKSIGDYAFYYCSTAWFGPNGITAIPEGTEYIGRSAFYQCSMMVGLSIPGSVVTVGDYAFYNCENLGESQIYIDEELTQTLVGTVTIGNGVKSIGERAFYKCSGITEIVLPDSLTSLGSRAFYKCEKLRSVTLSKSLTAIEDYTFYMCPAMENIAFPESLQTIGNYAFRGCTALKEINLGAGITQIGNFAFYGCTGVQEIVIPTGVTKIGDFAFRGCSSATSVIIPANVTEMGRHAFYGLNSATIWCEADTLPELWNEKWNTSYRPAVWGATLSTDKTYVISFVKGADNPNNVTDTEKLIAPVREGYTFAGFATTPDATTAVYTAESILTVEDGTTLYIVWSAVPTASE